MRFDIIHGKLGCFIDPHFCRDPDCSKKHHGYTLKQAIKEYKLEMKDYIYTEIERIKDIYED